MGHDDYREPWDDDDDSNGSFGPTLAEEHAWQRLREELAEAEREDDENRHPVRCVECDGYDDRHMAIGCPGIADTDGDGVEE